MFHYFWVPRKFAEERGWGVSRFSVEIFRLTVPKKFVREPIRVSLISGVVKIFASAVYVTIFDFLSKFFWSHSAEKFRR